MLNRMALTWLCLGFLSTVSAVHASATPEQKYLFEGEDITPFVAYFEKQVRTLARPVTVYTWSAEGNKPFWKTERPQGDPAIVQGVHNMAHSFWRQYGHPNGGHNMYGYGFYAALDPVSTASFGFTYGVASESPWLLTETRLVAGFRLVDVFEFGPRSEIDAKPMQEVATRFKCPDGTTMDALFKQGGAGLDPSCRKLARQVFNDILKIDGFAYMYGRTDFAACKQSVTHSIDSFRAIVITRPDRIGSQDVKIYTKSTTGDLEDRIRIQTLFLTAAEEARSTHVADFAAPDLIAYLKKNPDSYVKGSTTKCSGAICVITVHFCDDKNRCEDVALAPLPRPGGPTITTEEAKQAAGHSLLWPDLEGKPKATTVKTWLKENMYGCSSESPFVSEPAKSDSNNTEARQ